VNSFLKYFQLLSQPEPAPEGDYVEIDSQRMPVVYRRHARAKNYVLRLQASRTVVVTLPRRGSMKFAQEFVNARKPWLEKQWHALAARMVLPRVLRPGMEILFRGEPGRLEVLPKGGQWELSLGGERFDLPSCEGDLRPWVESHLRRLAQNELAGRVLELARLHGAATVRKVVVRNQKSRWGSCSYSGTISLNWRLIQAPEAVRDYIIIHELMHLRELNHSPRFWEHVERACPAYLHAEKWLKANSARIGF